MNPASSASQIWLLISAADTLASIVALVVLGVRRCWRSARADADPLWRAGGFAIGLGLLALSLVVATSGSITSVWAGGLVALIGATAAVLWAASMWTDRAPVGELVPGRYTTRPHRTLWLVGVWGVLATWGLLWWMAARMGAAQTPEVAYLVNVIVAVLLGGGLIAAWVQSGLQRSWEATGSRWRPSLWWRLPGVRRPREGSHPARRILRGLGAVGLIVLGLYVARSMWVGVDARIAALVTGACFLLGAAHLLIQAGPDHGRGSAT